MSGYASSSSMASPVDLTPRAAGSNTFRDAYTRAREGIASGLLTVARAKTDAKVAGETAQGPAVGGGFDASGISSIFKGIGGLAGALKGSSGGTSSASPFTYDYPGLADAFGGSYNMNPPAFDAGSIGNAPSFDWNTDFSGTSFGASFNPNTFDFEPGAWGG